MCIRDSPTSDLWQVPAGCDADLEGPRAICFHRLYWADVRTEHFGAVGETWLGVTDRGNIPFAPAALGFALYRPLFASYRAGHTLWRNRGSACQHTGDQCDRSRRRQPCSGDWLHRDLRYCERLVTTTGTHLRGSIRCYAYDHAVEPHRLIYELGRPIKLTLNVG